jgi:hypothetical protein
MNQLIEVVFTVCLAWMPASCDRQSITYVWQYTFNQKTCIDLAWVKMVDWKIANPSFIIANDPQISCSNRGLIE